MVYYDPEDLGWRPFVKSWMQTVGGKFKQETQVRDVTSSIAQRIR